MGVGLSGGQDTVPYMNRSTASVVGCVVLLAASLACQNPTPEPPPPKEGSLGHPEHAAELGRICDVIAVAERFQKWCEDTGKAYDANLGGEPMAPDVKRRVDALKAQKKCIMVDPPPPAGTDGWTTPESDKEREEDQVEGLGKYRHYSQKSGEGKEVTTMAPYLLDGQPDNQHKVTENTSSSFAKVRLAEIALHEMGRQTQVLCSHAECRKIQNDKKKKHGDYPETDVGDEAVSEDKQTYKVRAKIYDVDMAFYRFVASPGEAQAQALTAEDKKALGKFFGGLRTLKRDSISRMQSACAEETARQQ